MLMVAIEVIGNPLHRGGNLLRGNGPARADQLRVLPLSEPRDMSEYGSSPPITGIPVRVLSFEI